MKSKASANYDPPCLLFYSYSPGGDTKLCRWNRRNCSITYYKSSLHCVQRRYLLALCLLSSIHCGLSRYHLRRCAWLLCSIASERPQLPDRHIPWSPQETRSSFS